MSKSEIEGGHSWSHPERAGSSRVRQIYFGDFAANVLDEVRDIDPDAPSDILIIGENWFQLVELHDSPVDDIKSPLDQENTCSSISLWPIESRGKRDNLYRMIELIKEGVNTRSLDDRILEKLAVLDLTSFNPLLSEHDLFQCVDTPWGVNGILKGTNTLIYHIKGGYACVLV